MRLQQGRRAVAGSVGRGGDGVWCVGEVESESEGRMSKSVCVCVLFVCSCVCMGVQQLTGYYGLRRGLWDGGGRGCSSGGAGRLEKRGRLGSKLGGLPLNQRSPGKVESECTTAKEMGTGNATRTVRGWL